MKELIQKRMNLLRMNDLLKIKKLNKNKVKKGI